MNKKQPKRATAEPVSDELPNFLEIETRVFTQVGSDIYIGKNKIDSALRSVLRDEAKNLLSTRLWEILNASIINEAYNLALTQSTDFDQVRFAKALKHWAFFAINVINKLEKP